jgi:probable F420-dependent oxidoreductase
MGREGARDRGSRLRRADHLTELLAPLPALVTAADATTTLRLGTNVLNNDFRHPVLVAGEAATIDLLTDGRLELGLGAGHVQAEYDEAGFNFERGGARVERLGEAVGVIKGLMGGAPFTFSGRHYRVTGHTLYPRPLQSPHPPIAIGGNGLKLQRLPRARPTSSASPASPSAAAALRPIFRAGKYRPWTSASRWFGRSPANDIRGSS